MVKAIWIILVLFLSGCNNNLPQTGFRVLNDYDRQRCEQHGGDDCNQHMTYEEYQQHREQLLESDQSHH